MIFTENTGLMYYGFTKGLKVIGGQNFTKNIYLVLYLHLKLLKMK